MISQLLLVLGLLCLMFADPQVAYVSAISFGLSESLSSGVLVAYHFEIIDNKSEYDNFLRNLSTIKYLFIAMITMISPYLLQKNYLYPIMLSILFVLLSLLNLSRLPEIKGEAVDGKTSFSLQNMRHIPWDLIVLGVTFSTLIMIVNSYSGVYLNQSGISLKILGFILFIFNLSMAIGSYLKIRFALTLLLPMLVICLSLQSNPIVQIIIFLIIRALNSSYNNHFYSMFNTAISNNRATSWSIFNFLMSITFILADFLAGILAENFGLQITYQVFGSISLIFLILYFTVKKKTE